MARHRKPRRNYGYMLAAAGTLAISIGAATAITVGTSSATVASTPEAADANTSVLEAEGVAQAQGRPRAAVPLESYNALNDAQQYINQRATSEKALKDHLQRAGYSRTATNYATSNVRVDYGAEAKELAGSYMQATEITEQGMRKQLRSDGFNAAQVDAAVAAAYGKKGE